MFSECLIPGRMDLPVRGTDLSKWACIACDQHSSEPSYWQDMERLVGSAPSTLHMILPECYLQETGERIPRIQQTMQRYLQEGILQPLPEEGYILTARTTQSGTRLGLMGLIDLEAYDYRKGSRSPIRASEETIEARIPPRMKIREGATVELPHVLLLMNDAGETVLEPIYARRETLPLLYDTELLLDGGQIRGWGLFREKEKQAIRSALEALPHDGGLLFAVGDGNHSLATAKACWEKKKETLTWEEQLHHPARFALVELVNIHSKALRFAPIHRVVFGTDLEDMKAAWLEWLQKKNRFVSPSGGMVLLYSQGKETQMTIPGGQLEVAVLQEFLDEWLKKHPSSGIDYIHGESTVRRIADENHGIAFLLPKPDRDGLFESIARGGSLPRKTFSMGSANEKRYYLECRRITAE